MLIKIIQGIRALFPVKCCHCGKKGKAKDMINWFGKSYVCPECYYPKPKRMKKKFRRGKRK